MSSLLTRFSQVHPQDCPNPKMPLGSPLNPAFPPEEEAIKAVYAKVLGSAVNP